MADPVVGFIASAVLCAIGVLLAKRCTEFEEGIKNEQEYILITKEHYEIMKNNPDVKKIIFEQPQNRTQMCQHREQMCQHREQMCQHREQMCQHRDQPGEAPPLPNYSESDKLIDF